MRTRKALVRFDSPAHGMFSARTVGSRLCGMQLNAAQVAELRDALIDFTRDGAE